MNLLLFLTKLSSAAKLSYTSFPLLLDLPLSFELVLQVGRDDSDGVWVATVMNAQTDLVEREVPRRTKLTLVSRHPQHNGIRVLRKVIAQKAVKNNVVHNVLKVAWAN